MARRTTITAVAAILGTPPVGNWDGVTDLLPFIDTANPIVTRAVTLARQKGVCLTGTEQELMERWLTGYFYVKQDPLYQSKSTGGASGSFIRKQGEGFEENDYGAAACRVDYSGALSAIGRRAVCGGTHVVSDCLRDQQRGLD